MKLGALAAALGARLAGAGAAVHAEREVQRVASLDDAGPEEVAALYSARAAPALMTTRAAAVLVGAESGSASASVSASASASASESASGSASASASASESASASGSSSSAPAAGRASSLAWAGAWPEGVARLEVDDARAALAQAARLLHGARPWAAAPPAGRGCADPQAYVAPGADVAPDVTLFPFSYVGPGAVVGAGTVLETGARVMDRAVVGRASRVGAGAYVGPGCVLGARVVLGPNAVVGGEGFGFTGRGAGRARVPHVGIVVLEDDVELGAGTCVDRAALGETRVGRGAKLDNLVHVAHNVRIGPGSVIAAQTGLSGSAVLGAEVALGGQVGVSDHARLGDGARVAAQAGVPGRDYPAGATLGGSPAVPVGEWRRTVAALRGLGRLRQRVAWLWERLAPGGGRGQGPGEGDAEEDGE